MDANEAIRAARDCVTRAIANEGVNQLSFQKAVLDPNTKEWRITFRIMRTTDKGDKMCASSVCTVDDADGQVTSTFITDCHTCDRKCANQASEQDACNAKQNEQPSHATSTSVLWRDSLQSLYRALFAYPRTAVGFVTIIGICVAAFFRETAVVEEALIPLAALVGLFIGLFVAGEWWLKRGSRRSDSNRRNRRDR